jgi:alpha-galactosidase
MKRVGVALVLSLLMSAAASGQKFEELCQTPPMGWNTWNLFNVRISEDLIKGIAEAMVSSGMKDAGYAYVVLDDAWSTRQRDGDGNLVADPQKFPGGMKALGDFLHDKGLKFGIYNCAGTATCAGYPGGHGYEVQDAKLYASWGVDYLKYDWCNTRGINPKEAYTAMRDALYAAGRPVVFSMCEWGQNRPWEWAADIAHLWRTTGDISASYGGRRGRGGGGQGGWKGILDRQVGLEKYAGPGHWNDPDMLEVGNGNMTLAENRSHFGLWCILAAPLMAGNDLRNMTDEHRDILINKEVIAIDQDPLGKQGFRVSQDPAKEVWAKELAGGKWAVGVLNAGSEKAKTPLAWKDLDFLKGTYTVHDAWQKKDVGTTATDFEGELESHDLALFILTPVKQ